VNSEPPGKLIRSTAQIGCGAQKVAMPVWTACGRQPGRTGFICAGIHGDEVHAIALLHRFVQELDLNRCFPGDRMGTLSERIADYIFTELAAKADWGVDLHDSGRGSVLLPHARVHDPGLLELGAAFGTEIVMKTTLPPGYHGILSIEARKRFRRPFFHVEVGGGTILWEHLIEQGLTGLRNLLIFEGMLPGKRVLPRHQFFLPGRDNLAMPAPLKGLVIQHVALWQTVIKGQPLATIENPLGKECAVIRARADGVVHDLNIRAKVNRGDDVVGVLPFGTFTSRKTKPWRHAAERRANRPGKTARVRDSEIPGVHGLCWVCHRPGKNLVRPFGKPVNRRAVRLASRQPGVWP